MRATYDDGCFTRSAVKKQLYQQPRRRACRATDSKARIAFSRDSEIQARFQAPASLGGQ
jgi:hypothetical protein